MTRRAIRNSVLAIVASGLILAVGPVAVAATHTPLDFSSQLNFNLQEHINPGFPTGTFVTPFGVPFQIPLSGNNAWGAGTEGTGESGLWTLEVPVNRSGVTTIYTLASTWWGENGARCTTIIAHFEGGKQAIWHLVDGEHLRDWNLYFTTTINNTSANEVFRLSLPTPVRNDNPDVLDMQTLRVPDSLHGLTLTRLIVEDLRNVGYSHAVFIAGITVSTEAPKTGGAIEATSGLLLWNKLGSEQEVFHSEVGAGFVATPGVLYVPGKFGGAIATTGGENGGGGYLSMSPDQFFPRDKTRGTVEAWIQKRILRLTAFQTPMVGIFGWQPYAYNYDPTEGYKPITAWWDEGFTGFGGLAFRIEDANEDIGPRHEINDLGWNEVPVGIWVHVAFVWDLGGISGTADTMRIYRDGQLVVRGTDPISEVRSGGPYIGDVRVLGHHAYSRLGEPLAYLDNLKVWSFAKTDFSDRFSEGAEGLVVDDGDPGTLATGTWSVSGGADPWDGRSLYSSAAGAEYRWKVPVPEAGSYEVFIWWTSWPSRLPAVPVSVRHAFGTATLPVDQRLGGGEWTSLGVYSFSTDATVTVRSLGGGSTCADAVKLLRTDGPPVSPPLEPIIIDDGSSGTSWTGSWPLSGAPSPWNGRSLYSKQAGAEYRFETELPEAGSWEVFLWWTSWPSRLSSVPVIIEHAGAITTRNVNQLSGGGTWNSLGTYEFGADATIRVRSLGVGSTCADAVKLVRVAAPQPPPPPQPVIVDNGAPGTSRTGAWLVSGGPDPWGTNSLYSKEAGATYRFDATLPQAGKYEVFLWWTSYPSRLPAVPVTVRHALGDKVVLVNQLTNGGRWNSVGIHDFTTWGAVTVNSPGGGSTCADAVSFVAR